jgi:hypothetical protein
MIYRVAVTFTTEEPLDQEVSQRFSDDGERFSTTAPATYTWGVIVAGADDLLEAVDFISEALYNTIPMGVGHKITEITAAEEVDNEGETL